MKSALELVKKMPWKVKLRISTQAFKRSLRAHPLMLTLLCVSLVLGQIFLPAKAFGFFSAALFLLGSAYYARDARRRFYEVLMELILIRI